MFVCERDRCPCACELRASSDQKRATGTFRRRRRRRRRRRGALEKRRDGVVDLLRVQVHVGECGVALVLNSPALLLAALDTRRGRERGEDGAAQRDAGGEVGGLAALQQRERLLHEHDLAAAERRVHEDVHDAPRLELLAESAQAARRIWEVVEHPDAVDEIVLAAEGGHVVQRHVVEDCVVGLADQAGPLRALSRDL